MRDSKNMTLSLIIFNFDMTVCSNDHVNTEYVPSSRIVLLLFILPLFTVTHATNDIILDCTELHQSPPFS